MIVEWFLRIPAPLRMALALPVLIIGAVLVWPAWLAMCIQARMQLALGNQRGEMDGRISAIVVGVITLVIGMVLASTVNSQAASLGSNTNIGSFTGAQAIGDLIPLVYIAAILMIGVGLIGMGAAGFAGRGPMGRA